MSSSDIWQVAVTVLIAAIGSNGLWACISAFNNRKSAQTRMLLGLSHDKIMELCDHYTERGGCTQTEMTDLLRYHFRPYADAGGNGTAEWAVNKVKALPFISREEAVKRDAALKSGAEKWW